MHTSPSSPLTNCTQTWSAPASRCSRTRSAIASASPHATVASTSRSLPPSLSSSLVEAHAFEVLRVVRQLEVAARPVARGRTRSSRVGVVHRGELDREHRLGAEHRACMRRVGHRHEVGVRAERSLGGQPEHAVAERGEHAANPHAGWGCRPRRVVHALQVGPHALQRTGPRQPPRLGGVLVADTDAEHHPLAEGVGERASAGRHHLGRARRDVRDARAHRDASRSRRRAGPGGRRRRGSSTPPGPTAPGNPASRARARRRRPAPPNGRRTRTSTRRPGRATLL